MGPFFLGWVDSRERALSWTRETPRHLVLRLERVPFIDATGLKRLESTLDNLRKRGIAVLPTGANLRALRKLVRAEIVRREDPGRYFKVLSAALQHVESTSDDAGSKAAPTTLDQRTPSASSHSRAPQSFVLGPNVSVRLVSID